MPSKGRAPWRQRRRGGVIIILAVSMTVIAGLVALAFDLGYARLMRQRLDMALEAASHAASLELDGTDAGVDNATEAAIAMAGRATIAGNALSIDAGDVEFGIWDDTGRSFSSETDPELINAVRVNANVTIPLLFGLLAFQGSSVADGLTLSVSQVATQGVAGGAQSVTCVLPLAVPSCYVDADDNGVVDSGVQDMLFDAGACAHVNTWDSTYKQAFMATAGAYSAAKMVNLLNDCSYYGAFSVDDVLGSDVGLKVDNVSINNTGGVMETLQTMFSSTTTSFDSRWSTTPSRLGLTSPKSLVTGSNWTKTVEGVVMIVDVPSTFCTDHKFDTAGATGTVTGFMWAGIYDLQKRCINDNTGATITSCSSTLVSSCATGYGGIADKAAHIRFRLDASQEYQKGSVSGGPDYGVTAPGGSRLIPQ